MLDGNALSACIHWTSATLLMWPFSSITDRGTVNNFEYVEENGMRKRMFTNVTR